MPAPITPIPRANCCLLFSRASEGSPLVPVRHSNALHLRPRASVCCAFHCCFNEGHSSNAVLDVGKITIFGNALPGSLRTDCSRCFDVDVCKGLDKAFRLSPDQPSYSFRDVADVIIAASKGSSRSVRVFDDEFVWMLLIPLERGVNTVSPNI